MLGQNEWNNILSHVAVETGKSDTQDKPEKVKSAGMPPLLAKYKGNIEVSKGFSSENVQVVNISMLECTSPQETYLHGNHMSQ